MRASPLSYGALEAARQRNIREFAFGYTANSLPDKSGCGRPNPLALLVMKPDDAASTQGVNLLSCEHS